MIFWGFYCFCIFWVVLCIIFIIYWYWIEIENIDFDCEYLLCECFFLFWLKLNICSGVNSNVVGFGYFKLVKFDFVKLFFWVECEGIWFGLVCCFCIGLCCIFWVVLGFIFLLRFLFCFELVKLVLFSLLVGGLCLRLWFNFCCFKVLLLEVLLVKGLCRLVVFVVCYVL